MKIEKIEDLTLWKDAMYFSKKGYIMVNKFIVNYDIDLSRQLKRALISIPSNIAEGFGRRSNKDFIKFLTYSLGSLNEVKTQFYLAFMLNYINKEDLDKIILDSTIMIKKVKGFIKYLSNTSFN